jgi:hypothetical protein
LRTFVPRSKICVPRILGLLKFDLSTDPDHAGDETIEIIDLCT